MKVIIHRGSHEIGGSCLQLQTKQKLWVDFGMPLDGSIPHSYGPPPDAILISHPHIDHHGLLDTLPDLPVHMGSMSLDIIQNFAKFKGQKPLSHHFKVFEAWKPFSIGDVEIFPYLADHSSPEAFSFSLKAEGRHIFITADFRKGGAKKKVFENLCKNPPQNVDTLFIEGTSIQREKPQYPDEQSVEEALLALFSKQENSSFVYGAGQNIDRIVSVYRACKRSGKLLAITPYAALMLKIAGQKSERLPQWDWADIRIVDPSKRHLENLTAMGEEVFANDLRTKMTDDDVFRNPQKYVYYQHISKKFIEHLLNTHQKPVNLIYSMWEGYLKEPHNRSITDILDLKTRPDVNFKPIHTSGHASKEDILALVQAIKPKKVVPIHTDNPDALKGYLESFGVKGVEVWNDGEEKEI